MNFRIISSYLGLVATLMGVAMLLCVPWAIPYWDGGANELRGVYALVKSSLISFAVGLAFILLSRNTTRREPFLREAMAGVGLCWFLAIILGAMPFLLANVQRDVGEPIGICDAIFESASGLTTTGGTIFGELEDPELLPKTILFWRGQTHFIGGLGIICLFVLFMGQGGAVGGKAILKVEHIFSENMPFSKMRQVAKSLLSVYLALCLGCILWLIACGASLYDALYHSFSVVSLGGFSSHNASVAYFSADPNVNGPMVETGLILFMILSGTNFFLLYWVALRKPQKLFRDFEWRLFITALFMTAAISTCSGYFKGDFQAPRGATVAETTEIARDALEGSEPDQRTADVATSADDGVDGAPKVRAKFGAVAIRLVSAFRSSLFHTTSLATGAGLIADQYELWNSTSVILLLSLMFMGACSGSTAGGVKVYRVWLAFSSLAREAERRYRPSLVRVTKVNGEFVARETSNAAIRYIVAFAGLILLTTLVVVSIEPDHAWRSYDHYSMEKVVDLGAGTLAMFANVGAAFGEFGSQGNYGGLTNLTKLIFSWAMVVGRLEIWCVLALFSPRFWSNR